MKLSKVKPAALVAEVRKLALEHPDAVYPGENGNALFYTSGDCGPGQGCLIGQALQRLKVRREELLPKEGCAVKMLFPAAGYLDPDTTWLADVQEQQDIHQPWSAAVAYADEATTGAW